MGIPMEKLYRFLASLDFGLGLLVAVLLLLAAGSFSGGGAEGSGINDMALFAWLARAPLAHAWWLWGALAGLALLVLNTLLCSIDALRARLGRDRLLRLLAPQVMHLGFLLVVLAHLLSAKGGEKGALLIPEGAVVDLPGGRRLQVTALSQQTGAYGMPTAMQALVHYTAPDGVRQARVRPNHPLFLDGYGVYLKQLELQPRRVALLELHREPGGLAALAGALCFTVGNLVWLGLRRGR